jgi:hypothetical protein
MLLVRLVVVVSLDSCKFYCEKFCDELVDLISRKREVK